MKTFFYLLCSLFLSSPLLAQKVLWTLDVQSPIISTAIAQEGVLYFGANNGKLYAVKETTGAILWSTQLNGAIKSRPVLHEDQVLINDASGVLVALDKNNGQKQWQFKEEEKQKDIWDYYLSSPVLAKNKIYLGFGGGKIVCLSQEGKKLWEFTTGDVVHATPQVIEDKVYIGSFDGYLYCLDADSGKEKWKFRSIGAQYFPNGALQRDVLVDSGMVYVGSRDYNIYALDAKTGRGMWNFKEQGSWIVSNMVTDDQTIYFGTSDSHHFYAMNKKYGSLQWVLNLNMRVYGGPVLLDNQVVFGCFNGKLYGVDKKDGKILWEFKTKGSKENYAKVYNQEDHFSKAFLSITDYKEAENLILAMGSILATPLHKNNRLYFGSTDGNFYALQIE